MLDKLANLDRRWIFLLVALSVIIPLVFPINMPIEISKPTQSFYDTVESIPDGSLVCMSFDYGPGAYVECHPMAMAVLHHFFRKRCQVVAIALYPEGAFFAREALQTFAKERNLKDGIDFVNLGYKAGGEVVLRGVGDNFRNIYSTDLAGKPLDEIPLMRKVLGWNSFALVSEWSVGKPGLLEFVRVVSTQYGRPFVAGATAVTAPESYPFLNSGQLLGMLGGLRGAYEYEILVDRKGTASRGMGAQSVTHFTVAGLIVLANIVFFAKKRRRRGGLA